MRACMNFPAYQGGSLRWFALPGLSGWMNYIVVRLRNLPKDLQDKVIQ